MATLALDFLAVAAGLVVGSFLNVLSLRTLKDESIFWPPSHCPECKQAIKPWDNIPLLSFILLNGRCRFCRRPISWQYPLVELLTAAAFLVLFAAFGLSWWTLGMVFFVCTLIVTSVTDLRERLIPHDLTYPSMLVGVAFSAFVRNDLLGAMAGIGASYILFDFIAYYGLKLYLRYHQPGAGSGPEGGCTLESGAGLAAQSVEAEPVEVMGGGDAVLAAVISAYLGWQRLCAALLVGFFVGMIFGMVLLLKEMRKAGLLAEIARPVALGAALGFFLLGLPVLMLALAGGMSGLPYLQFGLIGALGGALMGIVSVGTKVSKPFPFGPALAAGGAAAIFWDPIGSIAGTGT